jgi:PPOX class probable F420-dependent enzyme
MSQPGGLRRHPGMTTAHFAPLAEADTVLLTTYRRDGTPVGTPVHAVVRDDVAYVRTFAPSGKMTRIRRSPDVDVAPCTLRGRVTGQSRPARARELHGAAYDEVGRALAARHPIVHGRIVPWFHRRRGLETVHLALDPR